MRPEELRRDLAAGAVRSAYYLYGDETYLMEREVKRFIAALVPNDVADFNLDVMYGSERRGDEIAAAAQTLPMFAERRLVVVRRSEALSEASLDILADYLGNPSPVTCLIFLGKKPDLRRKFFQQLKKVGDLVEFKTPYEKQLPSFITAEAAQLGVKISSEATELLVSLVGNNLQELASQIEKLAGYAGAGNSISMAMVRELASDSRTDSVFDLTHAVGEKNIALSLRKLQTVLRDGQAPLFVLNMLTRHFRQLWQLRELLNRKVPRQDLGRSIGLRSDFFLDALMKQAGNFTISEFRSIFSLFIEADRALKSSRIRSSLILEQLFMTVCSMGSRR